LRSLSKPTLSPAIIRYKETNLQLANHNSKLHCYTSKKIHHSKMKPI